MKPWSVLALFAGCISATVIGLAFILPISTQEVAFLDVTKIVIRESPRAANVTSGSGGGFGGVAIYHGRIVRPGVRAEPTLLSLNRYDYSIGDDLIYEVKIENVSEGKIAIPWNPHSADLEPEDLSQDYEYTLGYIALSVEDEAGERVLLSGGTSFYGSATAPDSFRHLAPGESVRVRAKVRLVFTDDDWEKKLFSSRRFPLRVKATFSLSRQSIVSADGGYHLESVPLYPTVESPNAVPIVVTSNGSASKH